mmetsp:Transcript_2120/g.7688  ORF Transcript_2120/g.7688 Transcript_2120/m.7688 type:complete len:188 (-) Transcript_2120:157-720(-)
MSLQEYDDPKQGLVFHDSLAAQPLQEDVDEEPGAMGKCMGAVGGGCKAAVGAVTGACSSGCSAMCTMCFIPLRAFLRSIPEVYYAVFYFLIGFIFPPIWLANAWWYQSENSIAKTLSFVSLTLWSILSLGSVIAILFYIGVIVPFFNLVPLGADPITIPSDCTFASNATNATAYAAKMFAENVYFYQ